MSAPHSLLNRSGAWNGPSRLWLDPESPFRESSSLATVAFPAKENFASFTYTWAYEGKEQEGLLLLSQDKEQHTVQAVWIDSWHMSDKFMICLGSANDDGVISVQGSYPAPPGPDWGWRIVIDPGAADTLTLTMYNITPEGQEMLAVEAIYKQQTA